MQDSVQCLIVVVFLFNLKQQITNESFHVVWQWLDRNEPLPIISFSVLGSNGTVVAK